jgi:hypothetical protein
MTSTDIAIRQPASAAVTERDIVDGWVSVVRDVGELADYIAQTDFVPKALRGKPAAIAACILTGREMGIGPMASLKSIHMVQGVPSLSSEYKRARALAAGHDIVYEDTTMTRCVVRGRRRGTDEWVTVTWTMDHAKRAKLDGKDVWRQYPNRMLQARATGELCDLVFPDCSLGLDTTEVLQDGGVTLAGEVEASSTPAIEAPAAAVPAPVKAQRRQRAAAPNVPPPAAAPSPPVPAAAGGTTLPPLPGEDETPGPLPENGTPAAGNQSDGHGDTPMQGAGPAPGARTDDLPVMKALTDFTIDLARHADHKLSKQGRCIYCDTCGQRLYQGLMLSDADRAELRKMLDAPGTATRGKGGQLTALWTILKNVFGFTEEEKEQARSVCEHVLRRDLGGSTGNMSYNEARTVLDTLANWQKTAESRSDEPRAVMIAVMAEDGSNG